MGNNSVAVIVVGILGFLAVIIAGKWLFEEPKGHCNSPHHDYNPPIIQPQNQYQPPVIVQPPIVQPPIVQPPIVQPPIVQPPHQCQPPVIVQPYPQSYPHYHDRNEFWQGYSDGWGGVAARQNCQEYLRGYEIGTYDRRCNKHQYYDRYCPPGLFLRIPGFNLRIH